MAVLPVLHAFSMAIAPGRKGLPAPHSDITLPLHSGTTALLLPSISSNASDIFALTNLWVVFQPKLRVFPVQIENDLYFAKML